MGNLLKTSFILSVVIGIMQSAYSENFKLTTITNDDDSNSYVIGLETDDSSEEIIGISKSEFTGSGKLLSKTDFTLKELKEGVTLVKRSRYNVVTLKARNVNLAYGGDIEMKTLIHALKGNGENNKNTYDLKVEKEGEGWKLLFENKDGSKLHFITNKKFLIGTVGIKKVKRVK